jgi:hypothetical protein
MELEFYKCTFLGGKYTKGSSHHGEFNIIDCKITKGCVFVCKDEHIKFDSCKFETGIKLTSCTLYNFIGGLHGGIFEYCSIRGILVYGGTFIECELSSSAGKHMMRIEGNIVSDYCDFNKAIINHGTYKESRFDKCIINDGIFEDCSFEENNTISIEM